MKVLIVDFVFVTAHKTVNLDFIRAVARIAETDVISVNGFYDKEKTDLEKLNVNFITMNVGWDNRGAIKSRLYSLHLMKKTADIVNKTAYDIVLVLTFDTIAYAFGHRYWKDIPIIVFHHKNIDELTSGFKRKLFDSYKNSIYHFVFEEFFQNYLVNEIKTDSDRVFTIPFPVYTDYEQVDREKKIDCVGLCNSNSEEFISQVIEKSDVFEKNDLTILLRSKGHSINLNNVSIVNGFMEYSLYNRLLMEAEYVLVPLPSNYVYRLSGTIYDAIARRKIVLTSSKFYAEEYERRYPGICHEVKDVDDLIRHLLMDKETFIQDSFDRFINEHSIMNASIQIENAFKVLLAE